MTETKRGRGRPRPQETIARDELAYKLLRRHELTRDELAARLRCTSHLAYLALWRLRRAGRVHRVSEDGRVTTRWRATR